MRVVIIGAGMNGLSAALLLAADGHDVTVLERDPAPPPAPEEAWARWERRGVGQFRQLHYLHPGWRVLASAELPAVVRAVTSAGALRCNLVDVLPEAGGWRPGDEELTALTARRPVVEAAVAGVAAATAGVRIRRGVSVAAFATGDPVEPGVPHVTGVVTGDGETVPADVVVDATGRRSALPLLLTAIGAGPIVEEEEDLGFVYYGRHFRSSDGSLPDVVAPLLQPYDSVSILTLPADNGTWGVGFVASAADVSARALRHDDVWMRALAAYPQAAGWADGEPLDGVAVMAKLPDRYRRFVVDGVPAATGVLAVGDSWACTNPSLGRGITMGLLHAIGLRDLLRGDVAGDPYKLALAWDDVTEATVTPWYRATLAYDRHRLAEIDAQLRGVPYETDDPAWEITRATQRAARLDGDVFRGLQRHIGMLQTQDQMLGEPGFLDTVIALGSDWREAPSMGPTRSELLAVLAG